MNIFYIKWKGYATSDHFRLITNEAIELQSKRNVMRIDTGNRNAREVNPQDYRWLLVHFYLELALMDFRK